MINLLALVLRPSRASFSQDILKNENTAIQLAGFFQQFDPFSSSGL